MPADPLGIAVVDFHLTKDVPECVHWRMYRFEVWLCYNRLKNHGIKIISEATIQTVWFLIERGISFKYIGKNIHKYIYQHVCKYVQKYTQ